MIFDEKPLVLKSTTGYQLVSLSGKHFIDCRETGHDSLRDSVFAFLNNELDSDTIEDFNHRYPVSFLVDHFHLIERMLDKDAPPLIAYLRTIKVKAQKSYAKRRAKGLIEMSDVPQAFPIGMEVVVEGGEDGLIGGIIKNIRLRHSFFSGPYYEIGLQVIHAIKGVLEEGVYSIQFGFSGLVHISTLPIRSATKTDKKFLLKRGQKFVKFCKPGTYASYIGNITQHSWWSARIYRADGRVVIDPVSFERTQSELWREGVQKCGINLNSDDRKRSSQDGLKITKQDHWRCVSFMYGFSFTVKQWGRLELNGLSDIRWRNDAFKQLVLPDEDKDLIYSLVKFHGTGFSDIIEGKGGGCIFLLHGEPGFGKTASAEAVAELLHKPLYSVSVGELGVDPSSLEASLRNILDVATIWNAVILLDEADIFLEERDEHNIARNAMVGVFLRLLEYHNGVLFLTTNRVKNFDKAFYSRISIAILYGNEMGKVQKIWFNLLGAAKLPQEWAAQLSVYDINGRQIKNSIRMGQTLAVSKGRKIRPTDLVRAVESIMRFKKDMLELQKGKK